MIKLLLIPISIALIFAGSVNDGVTGYVFSLPFTVILLYYISQSPQKWLKLSLAGSLALASLIYYTQSKNPLLYPQLGQELILHKDIKVFSFKNKSCVYFQPSYINEEFLEDNSLEEDFFTEDCIPEIKEFPKGMKFYASEVATSHQDFGKDYHVKFSNSQDSFYLEEEFFLEVAENAADWHYLKVSPIYKLSYLLYYPMIILEFKKYLYNLITK